MIDERWKQPGIPLNDRIGYIDKKEQNRFQRLSGDPLAITKEGVIRYLQACKNLDVEPDPTPIREIIDDAINYRRVFDNTDSDEMEVRTNYPKQQVIKPKVAQEKSQPKANRP